MSTLDTKLLIAETFINLVETNNTDKVPISAIVAACEKNRKTFYYHFPSRNHLIAWIFRWDIAQQLEAHIEKDCLVYKRHDPLGFDSLAYYTCIKSGVRTIDGRPFFQALDACLCHRARYYACMLADNSPDGLPNYLFNLYSPALLDDIKFILSNRYLKEANQRFLADFYTGAALAYFTRRVREGHTTPLAAEIGAFDNIIHDSLAEEITRQQRGRVL